LPTLFTHPVIPVVIASFAGTKVISRRLLLAAIIASILPDADVIGLKFGIPYGHSMGHRGFSHSITFALIVGLFGLCFARQLNANQIVAFFLLFLSTLSHGVLDALTAGGLGVAFFSPFSDERFFFSWRPITVSPMELEPFLRLRGWRVFLSEFLWVWLPALSLAVLGIKLSKGLRRQTNSEASVKKRTHHGDTEHTEEKVLDQKIF
jgi:inner membrane protein